MTTAVDNAAPVEAASAAAETASSDPIIFTESAAAKVADAVAAALDKLVRSLGDDITRAKDRQGRESIRTAE